MADEININILDESITIELQDKEDFVFELNVQGPQGVQGPKGEKGDRGLQGPQGVQGPIGPKGVSVTGVEEISKVGLVATYRMYFSDGTHFDYNVTNGSVEGITREDIIDKLGFEPASYTAVEEINDLIPNEATTNNKLADKAWVDGEISSVDSRVDMVVDDIGELSTKVESNTTNISYLDEKVRDIELFKFPNAVIIGEPTIQNGQVSGFSSENYMQFPFILDLHNTPFQIDFAFTTGNNVSTQQNILDSEFGIALAIANGKGLMAISSNGTSWDIGSSVGTIAIQPNTTYYARLTWNGMQYKTLISTNGTDYVQDMYLVGVQRPYPRTIFIGGCSGSVIGHTPYPFLGTINMNKAYLYTSGNVIWQGMDDAGLVTRADLSLSNLDEVGEARFNSKQDVIPDLDIYVKNTDYASSTKGGVIKATGNYALGISSSGNLYAKTITASDYSSTSASAFMGKGTLENIKENLVTSVGDGKYQNKLTAGDNITIENDVISVTGGGDDWVYYKNGADGYRYNKRNGYCEQWGSRITVGSQIQTVAFLKEYEDDNYALLCVNHENSIYAWSNRFGYNKTSTGFTYANGVGYLNDWKTSGYLKEGEY